MATSLEIMKKAEQSLEKTICRLIVRREECEKEFEELTEKINSLSKQSDNLWEQIKKLERES